MRFRSTPIANAIHARLVLITTLLVAGASGVHADNGDCSQPASAGAGPAASDCLFILRVAVGSATCTPACICAPLGSLPARTSDALLCLRKSVGQNVTLSCPCDLPEGDDFGDDSKDDERWGSDIAFEGTGTLLETSGRLEFRSTGNNGTHYTSRPWIASLLPYTQDWEVSLDTTNLTTPGEDDEVNSYGISVFEESDFGSEVFVEMYASSFDNPPARNGFYGAVSNDGDFVADVDSLPEDQSSTHGAVRITFDSTTRVLTLYYDLDRTNGYQWSELGSFSIDGDGGGDGNTNWGMTPDDRFILAVYGYTEEMPITAGQMYGDNFLIGGGVAP